MIDLSNNNSRSWLPLSYNFVKAFDHGRNQRAYFKATEGSRFIDSRTPALAKRALAAGMKVGWYHFANDWSQSPRVQAEFFVHNIPTKYQCIPCLDMEQGAPSASKGSWALGFTRRVEELTGQECMIYGSTYYLEVCFKGLDIVRNPLWIAGVRRDMGPLPYSSVRIPAPWRDSQVAFHQYSWIANVPGIPGHCDVSRPIHPHLVDLRAV